MVWTAVLYCSRANDLVADLSVEIFLWWQWQAGPRATFVSKLFFLHISLETVRVRTYQYCRVSFHIWLVLTILVGSGTDIQDTHDWN